MQMRLVSASRGGLKCHSLSRTGNFCFFCLRGARSWGNGGPIEGPLKPLDIIVLWCSRGLRGILNWAPMIAGRRKSLARLYSSVYNQFFTYTFLLLIINEPAWGIAHSRSNAGEARALYVVLNMFYRIFFYSVSSVENFVQLIQYPREKNIFSSRMCLLSMYLTSITSNQYSAFFNV